LNILFPASIEVIGAEVDLWVDAVPENKIDPLMRRYADAILEMGKARTRLYDQVEREVVKLATEIAKSNVPLADQIPRLEGDMLIMSDLHIPYHDADLIEEKITKKTKGIIPVHFAGAPVDMDKILAMLGGKPVIVRVIDTFQNCEAIDEIVVVLSSENIDHCLHLGDGFVHSASL
jgi:hypothetical protein